MFWVRGENLVRGRRTCVRGRRTCVRGRRTENTSKGNNKKYWAPENFCAERGEEPQGGEITPEILFQLIDGATDSVVNRVMGLEAEVAQAGAVKDGTRGDAESSRFDIGR